LVNDVRQMYGLDPVTSFAPALATIRTFFAPFTMSADPSAVAEFTIPTTVSTRSCWTTFCTAGTPVSGPSPSSTTTVSTDRPPSLLPCCSSHRSQPAFMSSPSGA
jgi:hypothetical protein